MILTATFQVDIPLEDDEADDTEHLHKLAWDSLDRAWLVDLQLDA